MVVSSGERRLRWWPNILPLLVMLSCSISGQVRGNATAACISNNQPRKRINSDPMSIVSALQSGLLDVRAQGYSELFGRNPGKDVLAYPPLVQLSFPRLGGEFESTAIIQVDVGGGRSAFVYAKDRGNWWIIGRFDNEFRNSSRSFERMIETRMIAPTLSERNLIVRTWGHGAEGYAVTVEVFRIGRTRLECIFAFIEEQEHVEEAGGGSTVIYEKRVMSVVDIDSSGGAAIVVSHFRVALTEAQSYIPEAYLSDSVRVACSALRWDDKFQSFQVDKAAINKYCIQSSRKASSEAKYK